MGNEKEPIRNYKDISGSIWTIFKAGIETIDKESDSWWEEMNEELDKILKKYEGTEYQTYARSYANNVLNEIERLVKKRNGRE